MRTNLYVLSASDMGRTWRTVGDAPMETPVTHVHSSALVREYTRERKRGYLKDINVEKDGRPVLLVVTSNDHRLGRGGYSKDLNGDLPGECEVMFQRNHHLHAKL